MDHLSFTKSVIHFDNRRSIVYVEDPQDISSKNIIFLFVKSDFVIANSEDLDEMPHYAVFRLGLYRLPKHLLRGFLGPELQCLLEVKQDLS